jgi:hypothetical protein
MHVGRLGRALRPPRWTSRRSRWRRLLRAGNIGVEHLRRSASDAVTNGPGMGVVVSSPATSSQGESQHSTVAGDQPRPTDAAPSAVVDRSAEPHVHTRLRSTAATHRQLLAARATPSNGNVHCGLHSPVRDSGCHQEGARPPPAVTLPPS